MRPFYIVAVACLGFAGCTAPAPERPAIVQAAPIRRPAVPALDWFHGQLAAARRARSSHLPHGDTAGAQSAYYAVMVPACERVGKTGPAKYRARCNALLRQATAHAEPAAGDFSCSDDRDDRADTPEEKTACND